MPKNRLEKETRTQFTLEEDLPKAKILIFPKAAFQAGTLLLLPLVKEKKGRADINFMTYE
jgi:hypothetical protein